MSNDSLALLPLFLTALSAVMALTFGLGWVVGVHEREERRKRGKP